MPSQITAFIEELKLRVDIVPIISDRLTLNKNLKALCPFHQERTPSFSVNAKGQYFHCFGCGAHGDVIEFVRLHDKSDFWAALSYLAAEAGMSLPGWSASDREREAHRRQIEDIRTAAAQYYQTRLTSEAKAYLTQTRNLTETTLENFQIGWADGTLKQHLVDTLGYSVDECLGAGVLKAMDDGCLRDTLYRRVTLPYWKSGRVVFLSGRTLEDNGPKYLNLSGEMPGLFNEDDAKGSEVFIVEGVFDCLSLVQEGYSCVAVSGSVNFKAEHVKKFDRCHEIYVCLDGDEAGERGALRIADFFGVRARIIQLPPGTDPNDYFKNHNKDEFGSLKISSKDSIQFRIESVPEHTPKVEIPRLLDPVFNQLSGMDAALAEPYLTSCIKPRFGLTNRDIDTYRSMVRRLRKEQEGDSKGLKDNGKDKSKYAAFFDGLIDIVEYEGKPAFLIKSDAEVTIESTVEIDGETYYPPPKGQIPWLLPRGEEVLSLIELESELTVEQCDQALYDDLLRYHKSVSELPSEAHYDLIVGWDLHTYLGEQIQYSPIICLFAVPERGKSRTGKGIIHVAYRGIHVESLRDPYLVRVANDLQASLFFDVMDIWQKAEKNQSEDILLHRFEKGAKVPRVLYPEKGAHRDIVYYSIFGPTIIATNQGVHRILETRAVQINMPETERRFELDVTAERAQPLRERLLAFRARHYNESLPDIPKPAPGRLGDIIKPLLQVIRLVSPVREDAFLGLVKELAQDRITDRADSLEAQVLQAMIMSSASVTNGALAVKEITDSLNEGKSERNQVTYQKVGRVLQALGFKKSRVGNNRGIIWDEAMIQKLSCTFGLGRTHETHEKHETHSGAA